MRKRAPEAVAWTTYQVSSTFTIDLALQQESSNLGGFKYENAEHNSSHAYILPVVSRIIASLEVPLNRRRLFEVGCGNGSTAAFLHQKGFEVVGVDPSVEGIAQARRAYPDIRLEINNCYEDLAAQYGRFPVVLSLEVVEHVFFPREFARRIYDLLDDRGIAIISTPFHGYWKNVAIALSGKMDSHFSSLLDYGHIKFWSENTLTQLLREAGFRSIRFERAGRIRPLAKSMIAVAER